MKENYTPPANRPFFLLLFFITFLNSYGQSNCTVLGLSVQANATSFVTLYDPPTATGCAPSEFNGIIYTTPTMASGFLTYQFGAAVRCARVSYTQVDGGGPATLDIGAISVNGGGTVTLSDGCGVINIWNTNNM